MATAIHPHSMIAYYELDKDTRGKMIFEVYLKNDYVTGLTDRAVTYLLGFNDLNACKPRITELIQAGILEECGKTKDHVTGRTVRLVRPVLERKQMEFAI